MTHLATNLCSLLVQLKLDTKEREKAAERVSDRS